MKTGINNIIQDMNKNISLSLAVLLLLLTGCGQEPLPQEEMEITIQAMMAENPNTKTIIQDGTTSVLWEPRDEVIVFYKTYGSRFISNNTEPSGRADFTGTLTVTGFFGEGFTVDTPLWAVSPYRADAVSDGESVTTTLISEQTGRAGSFAKNTFITLAKSTNTFMGFYNVCGGVRFSLTHEGIKEIVFQGQNNEDIAGKVKLSFVDGTPAVQEVVDGQKTITLSAPDNGTFETGKWYYIVALPGTLSSGFKMTFNTATQYGTLTSPSSRTIKRGIFGSLADADKGVTFKKKEGSNEPNPEDNIQFKDPIAKYACVDKFDTNGDGEVSYAEAAAATSLSGLFTNWNTVTEFDEIRYFTSVTSTVGVFSGLSKLTHITIPDQITTLGNFQNCSALDTVKLPAALSSLPTYCFSGCSDLKSVTLPTGITTIPNYAFQGCTALETLVVPSTITSIGQYAFSGCTVLTCVDMPLGFKTIGNYAFQNCQAILSVVFPASLTSIGQYAYSGCTGLEAVTIGSSASLGQYAFSGCTSLISATVGDGASMGSYTFSGCTALASVILPSDLTSIPSNCFQNCSRLATITWPLDLQSIGDRAFYGCVVSKDDSDASMIELPATVKSIGSQAFCGVRHLIMPSTVAISIQSDSFTSGLTRLYVPAGMVEMYKVRTNWSAYKFQIFPISEYPTKLSSPAAEPVDLGLSVKWASWNVGASAPEEYGTHFAWGEVEGNWDYNWSTYKWCNGTYLKLTKYCTQISYWDSPYTMDRKTVLDLEDDAAHMNWGGNWRMPTKAELDELFDNCTWLWTTQNGVNGRLFTGPNGNSIFLPAAGGKGYTDWEYPGGALFWSSSLRTEYPSGAYARNFMKSQKNWYSSEMSRIYGFSVRPVCPKD